MKWDIAAAVVTVAVGFGGSYAINQMQLADLRPEGSWDVAQIHDDIGEGDPALLSPQSRITRDGELQVVASYGSCAVVSGVDLDERSDQVLVAVRTVKLPGDCRTSSAARFVPVALDAPLGDRDLVDASTGRRIPVIDCNAVPPDARTLCRVSED